MPGNEMVERVMMNCKQATRAIEKEAEGKLFFWQRMQLRLHLLMCKPCMQFKTHWDALALLLKKRTRDAKLSLEDKQRMIDQIDEEILNS